MKLRYRKEALKDQENLSDAQFEEIEEEIEKACEEGFDRPNVKVVPNPELEHPIWQLKVDGEHTNHRIFLDMENSTLIVMAIWSFEFTHEGDQHWEELEDRM